jgi:hypothetical protein
MKSETTKKHLEETLMAYRCVVVVVVMEMGDPPSLAIALYRPTFSSPRLPF